MNFMCPICNSICNKLKPMGAAERYDCPDCGIYEISYTLLSNPDSKVEFEQNKQCLAKYLAETKAARDHAVLTTTFIKEIILDPQYSTGSSSTTE